jgi:hypothetical protein
MQQLCYNVESRAYVRCVKIKHKITGVVHC